MKLLTFFFLFFSVVAFSQSQKPLDAVPAKMDTIVLEMNPIQKAKIAEYNQAFSTLKNTHDSYLEAIVAGKGYDPKIVRFGLDGNGNLIVLKPKEPATVKK